MPDEYRRVVECTVMALSNLILKLSINMSKISILCVSKLLTPPQLNIFTTTILFEKYMEYHLCLNKYSKTTQEGRRSGPQADEIKHYLKSYPKTTYIKISQRRNPYDCELLAHGQELFGQEPNNLQFIELFLEEPTHCSSSAFGREKQLHFVMNLSATLGLSMPLGDEFFLFFSEILVPRMAEFKPDVIMYSEDIEDGTVGMQHHIRGMLINELSSKVQNKIYVFREFGIDEQVIKLVQPDTPLPLYEHLP